MDDATMSRIARKEARRRKVEAFAGALAGYLEVPGPDTRARMDGLAREVDADGAGEPWATDLAGRLGPLARGEAGGWRPLLALLAVTEGASLSQGGGKRLMDLSPYAGKAAVVLDRSMGYSTLRGDAAQVCERAVAASGLEPRAGGSYLILAEPDVLLGASVVEGRRKW